MVAAPGGGFRIEDGVRVLSEDCKRFNKGEHEVDIQVNGFVDEGDHKYRYLNAEA